VDDLGKSLNRRRVVSAPRAARVAAVGPRDPPVATGRRFRDGILWTNPAVGNGSPGWSWSTQGCADLREAPVYLAGGEAEDHLEDSIVGQSASQTLPAPRLQSSLSVGHEDTEMHIHR
jgi:hypothetical protein